MQHGPRGAHCLISKSTARGSARQGGAPGADQEWTRSTRDTGRSAGNGQWAPQTLVSAPRVSVWGRQRGRLWTLERPSGTVYSSVWYPRTRRNVIFYGLVTDWGLALVWPWCVALHCPLTEPSTAPRANSARLAGVSTPGSPSVRSRGLDAQTSSTRGRTCGGTSALACAKR